MSACDVGAIRMCMHALSCIHPMRPCVRACFVYVLWPLYSLYGFSVLFTWRFGYNLWQMLIRLLVLPNSPCEFQSEHRDQRHLKHWAARHVAGDVPERQLGVLIIIIIVILIVLILIIVVIIMIISIIIIIIILVMIIVVIISVIRQIILNRPAVYSRQASYLSCYRN